MKTPPEKALNRIGENEEVTYWSRRSEYEMVEEFAEGFLYIWIWSLAIWDISQALTMPSILYGLLFNILFIWTMVYEFIKWKAEIHVVTEYINDKGGSYYKFWGPFNAKYKEIPISGTTPDISASMPFSTRVWRFITGEHLEKVDLSSQGNTYINGRRMSPRLIAAIKSARGSPAEKNEINSDTVQIAREVRRMMKDGTLSKHEARHYARNLIERAVNG